MVGRFQTNFDLVPPMAAGFQSYFDCAPPMVGRFQSNFDLMPPMVGSFQSKNQNISIMLQHLRNISTYALI
ncbi:hypothetical protein DRW42_27315 [Pedobacter miscanthi]|uniref:Uncharacterized protein n=1 Tax=Pedobacter miscanthi TaxID=2259170 RepID=A0A366KKX0_9SPHI|nr:hypothetical protein DRW42_27315 [Pedobacter miscanthi]